MKMKNVSVAPSESRAMDRKEPDFKEIHRKFRIRINRYLAGMVGDAEAEDLTQEVFSKVHLALEDFQGKSSLSTWIYRIATNCAIDRMRSPSWQRNPLRVSLDAGKGPEAIDGVETSAPERTIEDDVIRREMSTCIREVIDHLPQNDRTVIILSDIEGFCDDEISEILAVSLEAAKIRLHRARNRLRKELEKRCLFYHDSRNEFACEKAAPITRPTKRGD